eukprot:c5334_g1_i1 orf=31-276(-)
MLRKVVRGQEYKLQVAGKQWTKDWTLGGMPIGQIAKSIKGPQVVIAKILEKLWIIKGSERWWGEQLEKGWAQKIPRKLIVF